MTPVQCTSLYEVQVASRCLVKASNTSIEPHVVTVSNLDLITRIIVRIECSSLRGGCDKLGILKT